MSSGEAAAAFAGGGGGGGGGEDLEGIDPDDELYSTAPRRTRKMFAFEWSEGYVSPFLASPDGLGERMLAGEGVDERTVVCDLGSGEGDLLVAAAAMGAHAVGFELDEKLNEKARLKLEGSSYEILRQDFLSPDLDLHGMLQRILQSRPSANRLVLVMYLLPEALIKLAPTLERTFPLCSAMLTVRWPLPNDWQGEAVVDKTFPPSPINNGTADGYWVYRPPGERGAFAAA